MNTDLRDELLRMLVEDQRARKLLIACRMQVPSIVSKVMDIDRRNTARLKEIVETHGWPTKSLVGEDGAHAAFFIVQHADNDPAFQESMLGLMQAIVSKKPDEVFLPEVAMLTDRVRIANGKDQLYGTQVGIVQRTKKLITPPVEDPDHLEERRAAFGLPSMEEYLKQVKKIYGISD